MPITVPITFTCDGKVKQGPFNEALVPCGSSIVVHVEIDPWTAKRDRHGVVVAVMNPQYKTMVFPKGWNLSATEDGMRQVLLCPYCDTMHLATKTLEHLEKTK